MKNRISIVLFIASIVLISCSSFSGLTKTEPDFKLSNTKFKNLLTGIWTGSAYQYNIDNSWNMKIKYNDLKDEFEVKYPSLNCSGIWKVQKISENVVELRELILEGTTRCIEEGIIKLTFVNESEFDFLYYELNSSDISARGSIKR